MTKHSLIKKLNLIEHIEGGYFYETYRSDIKLDVSFDKKKETRPFFTSMYYMITNNSPINYFHINKSDIVHYFHLGSPLTYWIISPQGKLEKIKLGSDIELGHFPQLFVKGGYWKSAILEEGDFSLIGEAVYPGFEYQDSYIAQPKDLKLLFPHLWNEIKGLVKPNFI